MLIGANKKAIRKHGKLQRQDAELSGLRELNRTYKQQIDGLLAVNKEMIQKLAGLGIRVKIERAGVSFEAIK